MASAQLLLADALLGLRQLPRPQAIVFRAVVALILLLQQHCLCVASPEAVRRFGSEAELTNVLAMIPALVYQEVAYATTAFSCQAHIRGLWGVRRSTRELRRDNRCLCRHKLATAACGRSANSHSRAEGMSGVDVGHVHAAQEASYLRRSRSSCQQVLQSPGRVSCRCRRTVPPPQPTAEPRHQTALGAALRIIGTTLICLAISAVPSQLQLGAAGLALQGGDLIGHAGGRRCSHAMHRAPRSDPGS